MAPIYHSSRNVQDGPLNESGWAHHSAGWQLHPQLRLIGYHADLPLPTLSRRLVLERGVQRLGVEPVADALAMQICLHCDAGRAADMARWTADLAWLHREFGPQLCPARAS